MKKDGRTYSHETLEQLRMLGIERIRQGENPARVAESFGLHRSWGYRIVNMAAGRGRGKRALKSTVGTGRPRKLTASQEREVFRCMDGKCPHQYGFDFALWTRAIVAAFILERFDVSLSLASVGTMLTRLGLTVQRPLKRAYQRNPQAITQWKEQTFPDIASQAKQEGADIYFWDDVGLSCRQRVRQDLGCEGADSRGASARSAPEHQRGQRGQQQGWLLVCHLQGGHGR